ncbi:hypothetical protein Syun_029353 [Stephania yunnanensis]|uniref:Uncharacterized protein n=1 Tax=Stephania yunnanensis TaxID=152371 RepID=A0AAP0E5F3_9MAGN
MLNFTKVFSRPSALPSARIIDHRISLLPGIAPVNVHPYRYPHFQKNKIKRLVSEMLTNGVIRLSTSHFLSPVLLVKKRRIVAFCVYYRPLNAITVKDRFPIPTVDELLDELFGTRFFFKLDLNSRLLSEVRG